MEAFPETQLFPLFASILAACAIGSALYWLGGREGRSWAVPAASFVFFLGIDRSYEVPTWALLVGFALTTTLFHALIKSRQRVAARGAERLVVPAAQVTLRRVPDYSGRYVGLWTSASDRVGPEGAAVATAMTLGLAVEGLSKDEYRVVLTGTVERSRPGALVFHHEESGAESRGILSDQSEISGLPAPIPNTRVRALPDEYAFRVLDFDAAAAIREILDLRSDRRDIYVQINGPQLRIVSTVEFLDREINQLLAPAARLLKKMDALGAPEM